MNNNLSRVYDTGQMELFPRTVNEACCQVGIQLWTVSQLHKAGLISFDPEGGLELTASQYAELCFVGALVAANCSPSTITNFLSKLEKPYNYRHSEIYYDWAAQEWEQLPIIPNERDITFDWISSLAEDNDIETLQELHDQIECLLED